MRTFFGICLLALPACIIHVHDQPKGEFNFSTTENMSGRAERELSLALNIRPEQTFNFSNHHGSIRIRVDASASPSVQAKLSVQAASDEEAQQILDAYQLIAQSKPTELRLELAVDPAKKELTQKQRRSMPSMECEIVLPENTRVSVLSGSGAVSASGPLSTTGLSSNYGAIRAQGIRGALVASTQSGAIEVSDIAGNVELKSNNGSVKASKLEGTQIQLSSGSGNVQLSDARAQTLEIETKYGQLELSQLKGSLNARTNSGSISARDLEGAALQLRSDNGQIRIERSQGDLKVHSGSGSLTILDAQGALQAHSNYGAVDAVGVFRGLTVSSASGRIAVQAKLGSVLQSDASLSSNNGSVSLAVPADFACQLEATTQYGQVSCDFPVTIEAGSRIKDGNLVGQIGSGGKKLSLKSGSGAIALKKL